MLLRNVAMVFFSTQRTRRAGVTQRSVAVLPDNNDGEILHLTHIMSGHGIRSSFKNVFAVNEVGAGDHHHITGM